MRKGKIRNGWTSNDELSLVVFVVVIVILFNKFT